MRFLKKAVIFAALLCVASPATIYAEEKTESSFYFGLGGGYGLTHMSVSDLDKDYFPDNKNQGSGIFDFYLQYEFGKKKQFGVRLEFDFLKRGGTLNNILNTDAFPGLYEEEGIKDVSYKLRSRYFDVRLPLIYQFGEARSALRPYIFVAPMVCFSTGGSIKAQVDNVDGTYEGSALDITNGNMKQVYFAGAVGAGLKYDLNLGGHPFYLSVEVGYQMGFTDTYSSKEKSGSAVVKDNIFHYAYDITGTRRFNGFEVKGALSIPFSVFSRKKAAPAPIPVVYEPAPVPVVEQTVETVETVVTEEKLPCRSIEEITAMISRGEDIHGVTFCSIDDIRFETGSSNIDPVSHSYLDEVASIMKRTGVNVDVKGHTDNTGTSELNQNLSRRRAKAVVDYLRSKGVAKKQLSYTYYGETRPIADNSTEHGRSLNRRVEFEIK